MQIVTTEHARTEYEKLNALLGELEGIVTLAKANMNLRDAELNLNVNADKADIMDTLERNLRSSRMAILGSIRGTIDRFC